MRRRIARHLLIALAVVVAAGCFNRAAEHCPGCTIVNRRELPPPLAPGQKLRVLLIGGGFGFGDEWRPVIAALRETHHDFFVFAWPGPFQDPPGHARALVDMLQRDLDSSPSLERLVIFAHSAGGMLGAWVVRQLRVPSGKQVFLAAIASGRDMNFAPYIPEEKVNTPMGVAMGGDRRPIPPIPPGVTIIQYRTEDPPPNPPANDVYLGKKVGHDESVGMAAVPLVHKLDHPAENWYR